LFVVVDDVILYFNKQRSRKKMKYRHERAQMFIT